MCKSLWIAHNWNKLEPRCRTGRHHLSAFYPDPSEVLLTFCRLLLHRWQATATLDLFAGGSARSRSSIAGDILKYLKFRVETCYVSRVHMNIDSRRRHDIGKTRSCLMLRFWADKTRSRVRNESIRPTSAAGQRRRSYL